MIINNNVLNILAKYLIIIGMKIMGLFDKFKSDFDKWEEGAFEEKSSDAYENERQKWIKSGFNGGTGEKTPKMKKTMLKLISELMKTGGMIRDVTQIIVGQTKIAGIKTDGSYDLILRFIH